MKCVCVYLCEWMFADFLSLLMCISTEPSITSQRLKHTSRCRSHTHNPTAALGLIQLIKTSINTWLNSEHTSMCAQTHTPASGWHTETMGVSWLLWQQRSEKSCTKVIVFLLLLISFIIIPFHLAIIFFNLCFLHLLHLSFFLLTWPTSLSSFSTHHLLLCVSVFIAFSFGFSSSVFHLLLSSSILSSSPLLPSFFPSLLYSSTFLPFCSLSSAVYFTFSSPPLFSHTFMFLSSLLILLFLPSTPLLLSVYRQ